MGTLKMRESKMWVWKIWHKNVGAEHAGLEDTKIEKHGKPQVCLS